MEMDLFVYLQADGRSGERGLGAGVRATSMAKDMPRTRDAQDWDIGMVLIHEPPRYAWGYESWE